MIQQLLIWVKENEPALTEIAERERLATEAERKAKNAEASDASLKPERAMQLAPLLDEDQEENIYDSDEKGREIEGIGMSKDNGSDEKGEEVEEVEAKAMSKDIDSGGEDEELKSTTVLVNRSRASTGSRPSSVATSTPSLVEAEDDSAESDWELV
jgi:hypothetical protein